MGEGEREDDERLRDVRGGAKSAMPCGVRSASPPRLVGLGRKTLISEKVLKQVSSTLVAAS